MFINNIFTRFILSSVTLALLFTVGCSALGIKDEEKEVAVTNNTSAAVLVDLWDLESTHTLDLAPSVPASNTSFVKITSNQSATLSTEDIKGNYKEGNKIRMFLYEIEGDSAFYKQSFSFYHTLKITIKNKAGGFYIEL